MHVGVKVKIGMEGESQGKFWEGMKVVEKPSGLQRFYFEFSDFFIAYVY